MAEDLLQKLLKKLKLSESTISTILGALVVIVVGVLIFNYFRGVNQPDQKLDSPEITPETEEAGPDKAGSTYITKPGDNLWQIAEAVYGSGYNWVDIAKINNLVDADKLEIGQELLLPSAKEVELKMTAFGQAITGESYEIVEGDHLWGIAVRAYGDGYRWVEIAQVNNLAEPNMIHAGNTLKLPR